jgi:hypothetical protein
MFLGRYLSDPLAIIQTNLTVSRLGDRHGENILFEEGTGGILHVDFNCLFDKVGLYPKAY